MKIISVAIMFSLLALRQQLPQIAPRPSQSPMSFSFSGKTTPHGHGWKHFKIKLPRTTSPSCLVWIEDKTHPVNSEPLWRNYDPRNVRLDGKILSFDAHAEDRIEYTVGWQK